MKKNPKKTPPTQSELDPTKWKERYDAAMKKAEDGKHAWFYYKADNYRSCAKCGYIERADGTESRCRGITKIELRKRSALR